MVRKIDNKYNCGGCGVWCVVVVVVVCCGVGGCGVWW